MPKIYVEYTLINDIKNRLTRNHNITAFHDLNLQIGKLIGKIETAFSCDVKYHTDKYNDFWIEFHPSDDYIIEIDINVDPKNFKGSKIEAAMHVELMNVKYDSEIDKKTYKSIFIEDFIITNDGIIPTKDDRRVTDALLYALIVGNGVLASVNNWLFKITKGVTEYES